MRAELKERSADKLKLVADRIIDAMKLRNVSRKELSEMMGVQPSIITRWLSGKHNFTIETILKLEDKLGLKIFAQ